MILSHALRAATPKGPPPIAFISSSTERASTSAPFAVDAPSGIQEGDLLLAYYSHNGTTTALTPPSGWTTLVASERVANSRFALFSLIAGPSEPSTYTFDSADSSNQRVSIALFRGGSASVDVVGSRAGVDGSNTIAAPSITTTQSGLLLAYSSCEGAGVELTSGPSGMTERFLYQDLAPRATLYSLTQGTGATGDKSFVWNNTSSKLALLVQLY